jgi:hypothetical protein
MAKLSFNVADAGDLTQNTREILPAGDYTMQIVQSDLRDTKAGDGQYIWLELEVMGPKYAGSRFWERLNLFNKSEATVKIAKKTLGNICNAVGVSVFEDTEQLHFKPMKVTITHKENKMGGLDARAAYYPLNGATPAAAAPQAAPVATASAAAPKPWERHKK